MNPIDEVVITCRAPNRLAIEIRRADRVERRVVGSWQEVGEVLRELNHQDWRFRGDDR